MDVLQNYRSIQDEQLLVTLHQGLLKVRLTEELLAARYREQEMRTPTHFGLGQEAVAVGVCQALDAGDVVFSHHRCHNHFLAKGGSTYELAAELYGRADGCSGGRGGSVHLTSPEHGFVATSAILGEMVAVAVGAALSFQLDGKSRIAASFFGEGAMDEGAFYEAINYAAIKKLPVLLVCENNLYATESPLSVRQAPDTELCDRVRSFKVDATQIDGNNVLEVYETARDAVEKLRRGQGPVFIECMTYRWLEHVGPLFDYELKRTYRTKDEIDFWVQERCPVKRSEENLQRLGIRSLQDLEIMKSTMRTSIATDIDRARNAAWPQVSTLFDWV